MEPKLISKLKEVERISNADAGKPRLVSDMTQNINDLRAVLAHVNTNQESAEHFDDQFQTNNRMASKLNQRLEENLNLHDVVIAPPISSLD